eukprot:1386122-Amphidinium_carterae.1
MLLLVVAGAVSHAECAFYKRLAGSAPLVPCFQCGMPSFFMYLATEVLRDLLTGFVTKLLSNAHISHCERGMNTASLAEKMAASLQTALLCCR